MNDPVVDWFSRRRFGLFLHFGLYAIEGWHEQDQMRRRIPRDVYERLAQRFNPSDFDADAIVDLARSVGMEYICLTTKHHDGFCLWDTEQTAFNVMHTPYGRDLVGQLAEACHRRAFPLGLYYSVADWHHPNYPNEGRHHELPGPFPGDAPDWDHYMDFLRAQVRELCTNYGEVRHFFWDMNVPAFQDASVNAMIRSLQPGIVINDRGFDAGDFGTPERDYNVADMASQLQVARPTEACNSVGMQSWGYRRDEDYYAASYLMGGLADIMARGGHYLLNVGPDASGRLPREAIERLRAIGDWYQRVREAFGDSEPCSRLTTNREVMLTRRGRDLYAIVLPPVKGDAVLLPPLSVLPTEVVLLNTGETLEASHDVLPIYWQSESRVLRIKPLPQALPGGAEPLVIRLTFAQPLQEISNAAEQVFQG